MSAPSPLGVPPPLGALRQRVALEAPQETPDGAGGVTRRYAQLAQFYAEIRPQTGVARFVEQRSEQIITHIARFRWRRDVTSDMRLAFDGRALLIRAAYDEDGRKRFLTCPCEEIAP
jgi:SPP1 family predicted phage head-tail adaptor